MRQSRLLEHPQCSPRFRRGSSTGLQIEPPSRWGSTGAWRRFRDSLASLQPHYRDDPTLPLYIAAADQVIAWRDTVPAQDWFWAADRP